MYANEINNILNKYKCLSKNKCFAGVFALNEIPQVNTLPFAAVINTQPRGKPGEHWVSLFINENKKGFYFDSYGLPPLQHEFYEFLNKNTNSWKYNINPIQSQSSIKCGHFCVIYLAMRCDGWSHKQILNLFEKYNLKENDELVKKYIKEL